MSEEQQKPLSRRKFIEGSSAALIAAAGLKVASGQETKTRSADHHLPNESDPGVKNDSLEGENPDSVWSPSTDAGGQPPFKYSFALSHKRIEEGGWTRQVTVRDLPISKKMAGVEMRLVSGGIRELHWHVGAEWALMLYGSARISAVDEHGRSNVSDVKEGDLWLFPGGIPHSIQGTGADGCRFLLVFDDGNFNEFETFLLTDWLTHVPKSVLAKNFNVSESVFDRVPKKELFMFPTALPDPLEQERSYVSQETGGLGDSFAFRPSQMKPTTLRTGGEVKIIDSSIFPVTEITAAIVTLKPGGLRELHWHPNADEWQYYIKGKARMGVFNTGPHVLTMDFNPGDIGYVPKNYGHYVQNIGDTDMQFFSVFRTSQFSEISLSDWLAH